MKKVRDLVSGQNLETISPNTPIINALRRMEFKIIHSLLVFEKDQFCGIVTMTDIAVKTYGKNNPVLIKDIMTPSDKVTYVHYDDGLQECRELMKRYKIHHLVVKDAEGKVKGVISTFDLMLADDEAKNEAAEIAENLPPT